MTRDDVDDLQYHSNQTVSMKTGGSGAVTVTPSPGSMGNMMEIWNMINGATATTASNGTGESQVIADIPGTSLACQPCSQSKCKNAVKYRLSM